MMIMMTMFFLLLTVSAGTRQKTFDGVGRVVATADERAYPRHPREVPARGPAGWLLKRPGGDPVAGVPPSPAASSFSFLCLLLHTPYSPTVVMFLVLLLPVLLCCVLGWPP